MNKRRKTSKKMNKTCEEQQKVSGIPCSNDSWIREIRKYVSDSSYSVRFDLFTIRAQLKPDFVGAIKASCSLSLSLSLSLCVCVCVCVCASERDSVFVCKCVPVCTCISLSIYVCGSF